MTPEGQQILAEMREFPRSIATNANGVTLAICIVTPDALERWADRLALLLVEARQHQETKDVTTRVDTMGDSKDSPTAALNETKGATVTRRRVAAVRAFNELSGPEARALVAGLDDVRAGRVRSLAEIDAEMAVPATCLDCGIDYADFPLDMILPRGQWLLIHPGEHGLLCAACIVKRAAQVPRVVVVHAILEISPPKHAENCRLNAWLNDGPCTCGLLAGDGNQPPSELRGDPGAPRTVDGEARDK